MCGGVWRPLWVLATGWLAACSVRPIEGNGGDSGDASTTIAGAASTGEVGTSTGNVGPTPTTGGTTGGAPAGTSTDSDTGPEMMESSAADTGGCNFICESDMPEEGFQCPGTKQLEPECADGQKCTIDGTLSMTHCVDIDRNPKDLYEPCTVMGDDWSGFDDCGLGLVCWGVDEQGEGICTGFCDGPSFENCKCADLKIKIPTVCQDCVVGFCIPTCDPLLQDCPGDQLCVLSINTFTCVLDASGEEGQVNDPCKFVNDCDKGLVCSDTATASSACDQRVAGCCQPFCEFPDESCLNPDQACVQLFDPEVEPEFKEIGVCAIPP